MVVTRRLRSIPLNRNILLRAGRLVPTFVLERGEDILNPVQYSLPSMAVNPPTSFCAKKT